MTFSSPPQQAFVWTWLPGEVEPVVAGKLAVEGDALVFNYGRSYLERSNAIALYEPELPLQRGVLQPLRGLHMAGCIRDGSPDAWGRRVLLSRLLGHSSSHTDVAQLDELSYLLQSGSDRVGALDFQSSPTEYMPRQARGATLEELQLAAEHVERGLPLHPELDQALCHGSSIGGARPKALIEDEKHKYIAKFSSTTDLYSVVKAEYVAMRLAALAGLQVAEVALRRCANKDVLLVQRFDRVLCSQGWQRRAMVSALTLLQLDEMLARYASYEDLAELVRQRFERPTKTLHELFGRLVCNVLCGNTDDHARNHAAFWNGNSLELTPAYDICPQPRSGNEASQAMLIQGDQRLSRLTVCLDAAPQFLLSRAQALTRVEQIVRSIVDNFGPVCDEAGLSAIERSVLWRRQFLNPFVFEDLDADAAGLQTLAIRSGD